MNNQLNSKTFVDCVNGSHLKFVLLSGVWYVEWDKIIILNRIRKDGINVCKIEIMIYCILCMSD